jgi:hypothetical protein
MTPLNGVYTLSLTATGNFSAKKNSEGEKNT